MTELVKSLAESLPPGTLILLVPHPGMEVPALNSNPATPEDSSPEEVARAKREAGQGPLTLAEWGKALPCVSTRELDRARKHGGLEIQVRDSGLGHGAVEATPDAILKYLQTCTAVQQGTMEPPTWWTEVRKGSNGRRKNG